MKTSLKADFAQIFSCCSKTLSCPKFGGGCSPPRAPGRTPMEMRRLSKFGYLITDDIVFVLHVA